MEKIILITGGGSGIGRCLTYNLVDRGYFVLIIGRRLQPLEQTKAYAPEKISILTADVSTVGGREQIVAALPKDKKLQAVVHNAAVLTPISLVKNLTLEDWRQAQAINVEAPLFLTQALLSHLNEAKVLHISSGLAHKALFGWSAYCTSKAALYMLYQCLNEELQDQQIAIGSVMPGIVDTPMQKAVREVDDPEFPHVAFFKEVYEKGTMIAPETVATFLTWLLLDVDKQTFAANEWDIYDTSHHELWLKEGAVPTLPEGA